jgi:hypothetical protein
MITFNTVRKLALDLPDVEESTSYGASSFKVGGKLLACPAINKSVEPNSLVVRIGLEQRESLLAEDPDAYYVTDHYRPYPSVLVRLSRIQPDALKDLLYTSWKFVTSSKKKDKRAGRT